MFFQLYSSSKKEKLSNIEIVYCNHSKFCVELIVNNFHQTILPEHFTYMILKLKFWILNTFLVKQPCWGVKNVQSTLDNFWRFLLVNCIIIRGTYFVKNYPPPQQIWHHFLPLFSETKVLDSFFPFSSFFLFFFLF